MDSLPVLIWPPQAQPSHAGFHLSRLWERLWGTRVLFSPHPHGPHTVGRGVCPSWSLPVSSKAGQLLPCLRPSQEKQPHIQLLWWWWWWCLLWPPFQRVDLSVCAVKCMCVLSCETVCTRMLLPRWGPVHVHMLPTVFFFFFFLMILLRKVFLGPA